MAFKNRENTSIEKSFRKLIFICEEKNSPSWLENALEAKCLFFKRGIYNLTLFRKLKNNCYNSANQRITLNF